MKILFVLISVLFIGCNDKFKKDWNGSPDTLVIKSAVIPGLRIVGDSMYAVWLGPDSVMLYTRKQNGELEKLLVVNSKKKAMYKYEIVYEVPGMTSFFPFRETISAVSKEEAQQFFNRDHEDWNPKPQIVSIEVICKL